MPSNNGRSGAVKVLNKAGIVISDLRRQWQSHCEAIEVTERSNPTETLLDMSTPLRTSLWVLAQQIYFINHRIQAIKNKGVLEPESFSLETILEDTLKKRRSTETDSWCLKRFMPQLLNFLRQIKSLLSSQEAVLAQRLETLSAMQRVILSNENSWDFNNLMTKFALLQQRLGRLRSDYELVDQEEDEFLREVVDEAESLSMACMQKEAIQDLRINSLLHILSTMGVRMARQTLITEYF